MHGLVYVYILVNKGTLRIFFSACICSYVILRYITLIFDFDKHACVIILVRQIH